MTTAIDFEVLKRRGKGRPATSRERRPRFHFALDLSVELRTALQYAMGIRFPSDVYRERPVEFFREILGVQPWKRQIEILEAVRDQTRVAVCSGHKIGTSNVAAGIALWYYCSHKDARVVMTSTTSRQVDQILWRELRMMRSRAGRCLDCKAEDPDGLIIPRPCPHSSLIEGEQGELARTGLKASDFREIVGFTAREAEAVAGISGQHLLYIVDEASGVSDEIFEAIEGNRAGGARILMLSNGTRNEGEFFEAFFAKKHLYFTLRVSSEETPNVEAGQTLVPGLATRDWIQEKRIEWGEDSALYKVRIKGEHALNEEGRIFSVHAIEQAEARWAETPDAGRLFVGVDPAGASGTGDETVFAVRRGVKALALQCHRGLTEDAHLVHLLALVSKEKLPRETPVVVLDREGPIGSALYGLLRSYLDTSPQAFELVVVRASDRAVRQPTIYDRLRDELAANLEAWFRDGGSIPEDTKLEAELHVLQWKQHTNGRLKVTPKDEIRKHLGRSPDRYDALSLACWEPLSLREGAPTTPTAPTPERLERVLDPYAASDTWRRSR